MQQWQTLPTGAGYSHRSGQATVSVRRRNSDTLEVTATCDSLQRQVLTLTEELTRIRGTTRVDETPPQVVREPTGWQWFWIRTGQLFVALALLRFIVRWVQKRGTT